MNRENEISEELNSLGSTLSGTSRVMPYSVPDEYFNNFPAGTVKMAMSADVSIPEWGKNMSYATPAGYFENLADDIISEIKAGHIAAVSSKSMPFSVPAGFFESLPGNILQALRKNEPVKKEAVIIPLRRYNSFRQIRWAAAAVLLICIGFGGYETFYTQPDNTEKMLASIPNNDIHDYLQHTYIFDVNRIVDNNDINNIEVDNKDIIQYLNETGWDMTE